jgi:hypothetical protein
MSDIEATCAWGDGPDILVCVKGHPVLLMEEVSQKDKWKHGIVTNAQVDLTVEEAERLRYDLTMAILQVKHLEESYEDFCKAEEVFLDDIPEADLSDLIPKGSLDLSGSFRKRFI